MSFFQHTLAIVLQIEFYFSPSNLPHDRYLQDMMHSDGWVLLSEICSWPRMTLLGASSPFDVARALATYSRALEVDVSFLFVRLMPCPVYIVPGSFQLACPPYGIPAAYPLPQHAPNQLQFQQQWPHEEQYAQHFGVQFPLHRPVSPEHFALPPNATASNCEPGTFPVEAPQQLLGSPVPYPIPVLADNPAFTQQVGSFYDQQQATVHAVFTDDQQSTQLRGIPTTALQNGAATEGEMSARSQRHRGAAAVEHPPQAMEAEEGNRLPSHHKLDSDHPGTRSMPRTHPVPAVVQPQGTAVRQRRDHGSRRDKAQQALHSAKYSCAEPATAAVSSHRAQLQAPEYHTRSTVTPPPLSQLSSVESRSELRSCKAERRGLPARYAENVDHGSLAGQCCDMNGTLIEQVGSDISSEGNTTHRQMPDRGAPETRSPVVRNQRTREWGAPASRQSSHVESYKSCLKTVQDRSSVPSQTNRPRNVKSRSPQRARRWQSRDGRRDHRDKYGDDQHDQRDRRRTSVVSKDMSPLHAANFPPLPQSASVGPR
ncbi:unnamed protein product [Chondrus crispus]|uniref:HTH La-type RNA-binding domain-containing protein n=1 Tax=Chondrus crispus TaxID=2769 RepID=R7QG70_CHOCR|nr:unnamed protein product [Chondrus crispus]CDF36778.1 unnamed protein product [Chondrus crispus]|eukprot:XP_005716597.1 unnamed protein product [Chondrus crispus]